MLNGVVVGVFMLDAHSMYLEFYHFALVESVGGKICAHSLACHVRYCVPGGTVVITGLVRLLGARLLGGEWVRRLG